jgi:hypothetical protein
MFGVPLWKLIVAFLLGGYVGQRYAHLHPLGAVRDANPLN